MAEKRTKKQGFENLNGLELMGLFEEATGLWEKVNEAFEEKQYGAAVVSLIALAGKIGEASPELAPALGAIIDSYGAASKPFFDQFFTSGTKAAGYFCEHIAEAKKTLLPQFKKHEEVKAEIYAMKLQVLKDADFSRDEAMDIILAEISGTRMARKSWLNGIKLNSGGGRRGSD